MTESNSAPLPFERTVYTVSRLNQEVKLLLEHALPLLWVEGEISNLARPRSGHLYFTLKDSEAQVRCAMFRNRNAQLRFRPKDGDQALLRARVGLYPTRGEFQLVVEHMEEAGDGALRRAFDALKVRLAREGLFAAERKRALPAAPRRIGIVTSPTGAALRDVLSVLRRRFRPLRVLIYPVAVQGETAAAQIAESIRLADRRREVDVLLLTRGGGSLEDLWAFNEEVVARAIFDCSLPIVSAVGHEVDFTISDFAADQRAPTPSAAAELLSPDGPVLIQQVERLRSRLIQRTHATLSHDRERYHGLLRRLQAQHPGRRLQERSQRLDELEQRLSTATQARLKERSVLTRHLSARLRYQDPRRRIGEQRRQHEALTRRLTAAMTRELHARRATLRGLARALETVSPLATLGRGYAIVTDEAGSRVLRDAGEITPSDRLRARLDRGELICRVETRVEPGAERLLPAKGADE